MFKLSPRLQAIYNELLPHLPVWDTCCDHGKIGLNAHESGLFSEVHLVDQVPSIIESLRKSSEEFRQDRGLSMQGLYFHELSAGDLVASITGNFVIAGVGAHTVQEILEPLLSRESFAPSRIVVSCHNKTDLIKNWLHIKLAEKKFFLIKELEILENSRRRFIWVYGVLSNI